MEIRALTKDDAHTFWHFRLQALELEPRAFSESAEGHRELGIDRVAARLGGTGNDNFVMGAFIDQQLAGTVGFFREPGIKERHKGRIWGMYVSASHRGRGVGRALLTTLLTRVRTLPGLEQVLLSVTARQVAAKELYVSLGFEVFGHEPNAICVDDEFVDEDHMILWLR